MLLAEMGEIDLKILDLLQTEFPLVSRPFATIGQQIEISEYETINRVKDLFKNGFIRQISAIFDTRRLGYDSCLIAMQVPKEDIDNAAKLINEHPGVSHNYSRSHLFNLWFTIATPPGRDLLSDVEKLANDVSANATLTLPALRMFKLNVRLDITRSRNPMATESDNSQKRSKKESLLSPLTDIEIAVIREMQENIQIEESPFRNIAERIEISETELFSIANKFIIERRMRRFAAVLRHRESGFKANAMAVWKIPEDKIEKVGNQFASFHAVSHCYERPPQPPVWPYNIFTMVHARTTEECLGILSFMSEKTGVEEYDYLFSEKEYKKTRVRYFVGLNGLSGLKGGL
jgi:DNA-binding Lrp family transcriptional regulator